MKQDSFAEVLGGQRSLTSVHSLIQANPTLSAMVSKLIQPKLDQRSSMSYRIGNNLDQGRMEQISESIYQRSVDAENLAQLFPDVELGIMILISSILSPKDMVSSELLYNLKTPIFPAEVAFKLLKIIKEELNDVYELEEETPDILREMLFESGSYVSTIIPESSIDELINGNYGIANESYSGDPNTINTRTKHITMNDMNRLFQDGKVKPLGILGPPTAPDNKNVVPGLESFSRNVTPRYYPPKMDLGFEVTDNFDLLKLPEVIQRNNQDKVATIVHRGRSTALENYTGYSAHNQSAYHRLFKTAPAGAFPIVRVKTDRDTRRRSIGRPLYMKIPSEAVIPVHVPGNEKSHIGYFIILDAEGYPLNRSTHKKMIQGLGSNLNNPSNSFNSALLEKARGNLVGKDCTSLTLDDATNIYGSLVEDELIARITNGVYGKKVAVSDVNEVYMIMLARKLSGQFTRLLYIPNDLITYFAYKFHPNGTGKSMLDDLKILTSLRAILLFSKTMAQMKNSIAITRVNMTIDPNDPDPQKTIEMSVHEIMRMRQQYFPLGINSAPDLVDWIQRAGFEFSFEGHPGLPQTKFDFEPKSFQHVMPDQDLDEYLRKQTFQGIGLNPEIIDNANSPEFATTVVANNILLSKRVLQIQKRFTPLLTEHVKRIIGMDYSIQRKLLDVITENIDYISKRLPDEVKEYQGRNKNEFVNSVMVMFIDELQIDLPKPDATSLESRSQAFDAYASALDTSINAWISDEFITEETSGRIAGHVSTIRAILKAHFLREWMSKNNYMGELADIAASNDDGNPVLDIYDLNENYSRSLLLSAVKYIDKAMQVRTSVDKDMDAIEKGIQDNGLPEEGGQYDSGGGGDDFGFDMGGDDFGSEFDEPADATAEETEPDQPEDDNPNNNTV